MSHLNANDLKTRGVAAIEAVLETQPEAMISVRGKERFVVMDVAHYHYLRECELDAALAQSQTDIAAGRFVDESAAEHVARLQALLAGSTPAAAPVKKADARKSTTAKQAKAGKKQTAAKRPAKHPR
jgi:PHD/YefM family antitoxin component YafN of YafNO toxin-antitoxin module